MASIVNSGEKRKGDETRPDGRLEAVTAALEGGDTAEAERLCRRVLEDDPDCPEAHHLLAVILHQRGANARALEHVRRALAGRQEFAAAWNNLGRICLELGRRDEAEEALRKAVALGPEMAEAHNNLGILRKAAKRYDEAEAAFRRAVSLRPDYIGALNNLGNLRHDQGCFTDALEWYGRALIHDPDHPLTNYNLGCTLIRLGRLDEAEAALRKALESRPDGAEILERLGMLCVGRLRPDRAAVCFRRLLALQPESAKAHVLMGNACLAGEQLDEAARHLERAVELAPDSHQALNNLVVLYSRTGRFEEARRCLERALELHPGNPAILGNAAGMAMLHGDVEQALALCRKAEQLQPDFVPVLYQLAQLAEGGEAVRLQAKMEQLLADPATIPLERMQLHFALAGLLEDRECWQKAFHHYKEGNRLKRATMTYEPEAHARAVVRTMEACDSETLTALADQGYPDPAPIFIVGMPRSGTTLVEQILASHPEVRGGGELLILHDVLADALKLEKGEFFVPEGRSLRPDDLRRLGAEYVRRLRERCGEAPRITNKMPGNFMYLGLIHLILPRARIVHCRRDPLDTCVSIFRKLFTYGHPWSYDLGELGEFYLHYHRLMEHWRRVLPGAFLDFRYEDLVRDQERETRRLLEFCGLEFHPACLAFYENRRPVNTASSLQVRRPLSDGSVGRWKHFEPWLHPLPELLAPLRDEA
ncbi:MAG: tetratricopeptide repeat-containing sulfotransferase family protein [Desulfobulbaceae bacterium]